MMATRPTYSAPLVWPADVARCRARKASPFKITTSAIVHDLEGELRRLGAANIAIATNAPILRSGVPDSATLDRRLADPGAVVWLRRKGRDLVFALDLYTNAAANLRGITLAIRALRSLERYGGGGYEDRAFSAFTALPATAGATAAHWSTVLGIGESTVAGAQSAGMRARLLDLAELSYRDRARTAHPDRGGSHEAMTDLNRAIEEARAALRG